MPRNDPGNTVGSVDGFFYWINERHAIWQRRQRGEPWPWTEDPILRDYYFTNVFRELDKTTVWLREHWREPHRDDAGRLIFNIVLARFFNWVPTLERIGYVVDWSCQREQVASLTGRLFSDAYMVKGYAGERKLLSVCSALDYAWEHRERLYQAIMLDNTLMKATWWLQEIPMVAGFMAYEVVSDLRHTPVLERAPDIMTWANAGPGAMRGMRRVFGWDVVTNKNWLELARWLLWMSSRKLGAHVPALEMRDIEHSNCEYDKYLRAKHGEGVVRKYRRN